MSGQLIIIGSNKDHRMYRRNYKMHTHCHAAVELQVGATIWATTKVERKKKDTSGGASERIRRDISYSKVRMVGQYCQWLRIIVILRAAGLGTLMH